MHTKTVYYMHAKHVHIICMPKPIFVFKYHEFSFLFGVLFPRIFMRPGSYIINITCSKFMFYIFVNFSTKLRETQWDVGCFLIE